ncbi:hypothetical protein EDB80DRAFT_821764 [Ilyonectria destructans]|nr:hypothetical protein EDB80DRAFT_821764 [Ilyonectria destructans]
MSINLSNNTLAVQKIAPSQIQKLQRLHLHFNLPEPAIICTRCGYALKTDNDRVGRHLGEKHGVPKSARRGLNSLINSLSLPDPDALPVRADKSAPHLHLALQDGSACKHCGLRSTSLELLSRHVKKSHRLEIRKTDGKGKRWLRDQIEDKLTFQSWKANDIHHSWIVSTGNTQSGQGTTSSSLLLQAAPDSIKDLAQKLFTEECDHLERQSGERLLDDGGPAKEFLTNWMRRTRWQETFRQARRDILVTLSEMPWTFGQQFWLGDHDGKELYSSVGDECKLASITAALDRLFDCCADTVRYTDVSVRRWLRGRFPHRPYKAPFEFVMRPTSERQYRLSSNDVDYGAIIIQEQSGMLDKLWTDPIWDEQRTADQADAEYPYNEDMVSESEESECEDTDDEAGDGEEIPVHAEDNSDQSEDESILNEGSYSPMAGPNDPHADVVLRFYYDMATEDFEDGRSSSSLLVYFSAARGLSRPSGNEYLRPARFTPILAALIYCARLIILETVLPRFPHLYTGLPARPLFGHLKALNAIRVEKMCDGTMSPLGEFLSLLAYGRALHRAEGPAYHFHWSENDQVLSWDGHLHLTMNSFRGLSREALRQATIQCRRLMYEWEPADPDLGAIRDRLSTSTAGYSFVADPTNRLADAYLEVFMRACTSPVDGLLKAQSKSSSTWDSEAAQVYLDAHDVLLKVLMVLCQLDSGQGARIPELLTIECCNTSSRLRGIGMYGMKMFSIIRHHKARLTTDNEFQVARFFSQPVAFLMYRYLVYISLSPTQ